MHVQEFPDDPTNVSRRTYVDDKFEHRQTQSDQVQDLVIEAAVEDETESSRKPSAFLKEADKKVEPVRKEAQTLVAEWTQSARPRNNTICFRLISLD